MLREAKVAVLLDHRLAEKKGVKKNGLTLTEIVMENGATFAAEESVVDQYLAAPRIGRGTRLSRDMKKKIWPRFSGIPRPVE